MTDTALQKTIDDAWEARDDVKAETKGEVRDAVDTALQLLDSGQQRVAEKSNDGANSGWHVNQWLKKAVLLSFRLNDMWVQENGPDVCQQHYTPEIRSKNDSQCQPWQIHAILTVSPGEQPAT